MPGGVILDYDYDRRKERTSSRGCDLWIPLGLPMLHPNAPLSGGYVL